MESPDACMIQCFIKIKCESYNIGPREKDGHVCELSDSDSHRDHMDWITKEGFSYVETLVKNTLLIGVDFSMDVYH